MDTWWERVRPACRASHRTQCRADMVTSRGEPKRWGRGARERQAGARLSLIQLHAAAVTPSPVDTLCASQTNGLSPCSAALFLSLRHAPPPLTHRLTHSPLHTHPHTPSHTPHSPSLTHTYFSYTLIHHLHTPHTLHKHIHSSHPHTPSHTHTLTHFSPAHIHTHTHTQPQSLQEHRHRKQRDPGAVLTHQACGACGNSPESPLGSVTRSSTHWEPLGLLEAP